MNLENYLKLRKSVIASIPNEDTMYPENSVWDYLMQAEELGNWCIFDKQELLWAGLNWYIVEDIPVRIGACKQAQLNWEKECSMLIVEPVNFPRKGLLTAKISEEEKRQYVLKKSLELTEHLHEFPAQKNQTKNQGNIFPLSSKFSSIIPDDSDEACGRSKNYSYNGKIRYSRSINLNEAKIIRDKAFTYLKQAVDEVRFFGKYVFWNNNDRLKGYI